MCDVSVPPIATKVRIHHGRFNQFRHCYSLIFASLTSGGGFLTVSFFCPPNLVSLSDGQDGAAFLPKEHFELYEKSEELIRLASLFGSLSCQIIRQNRSTSSRQKSRDILLSMDRLRADAGAKRPKEDHQKRDAQGGK